MWLLITLLGYLILAVVSILDKFILEKESTKPIVFVFYSTIFVLPIFLLLPFGVKPLSTLKDGYYALISGLAFGLAMWTMYIGLEKSEVSHLGPLIGAATPFFVMFLSKAILHDAMTTAQWVASFLLIVGSLIVSFEISEKHRGWHSGMWWGVLSGLLFAVSHVFAKYMYNHYDFYSGFVWTRGAIGLVGIIVLFFPSVYRQLFKKEKVKAAKPKDGKKYAVIISDKVLGVVGVILIQYAIALGNVSIVNALTGIQYGVLIILVAILSKFAPKLFKETYARGEKMQEAIAVAIIAAGLAVLLF